MVTRQRSLFHGKARQRTSFPHVIHLEKAQLRFPAGVLALVGGMYTDIFHRIYTGNHTLIRPG